MDKNITVVTAFFDIGRGNLPNEKHGRVLPHYQHRSVDTYFEYFKNLAQLKNDMVIYTSQDFAERIYNIRKDAGLEEQTTVVVLPSYLPNGFDEIRDKVTEIMNDPNYYGKVDNPQLIEYWHTDYVLVNIFKSYYVSHAITNGHIKTDLTAWIDFGYCRNPNTIPSSKEWSYDFDKEKIHYFNIRTIEPERPIDEIIYTGDVYIMGCHIVAGTHKWVDLMSRMTNCLAVLLSHRLIDDDQTLLLMSFLSSPQDSELHYVDPSDWFIIFKKFNELA